jgi:ribonucleoside-diphosphate reductase alpha chain
MSLKELSKFTITSKYAKYIPELKRRETWKETVYRCRDMHLRKYSFLTPELKDKINEAFEAVVRKECAPSMRSLQFGGEAIERKNARLYNCCVTHVYNSRSIEKAFWLLLCGCGVGLGLTKKYANQFPSLIKPSQLDNPNGSSTYVIPDTIEGWAHSVRILIDSFTEGNEYSGIAIDFDYSQIREKGVQLSIGGKAPGPDGLRNCHRKIRGFLIERVVESQDHKLRTIDLYDILMHCSDAVLSGGIRRSATIALIDLDDELMVNAKTGNWFDENPQRAKSNNSIILKRDNIDEEKFNHVFEKIKEFGEPGFIFVDNEDSLFNPCAEIGFIPMWNGEPAVQFCNLTIVNGNKVKTKEDLLKSVEYATIIGTLQAGYTKFEFLDAKDEAITEDEALLGVSILGFLANPDILVNPDVQKEASNYAVKVNEEWAQHIGINKAARVTCVKPDGNSAAALESPFSGIHPAHSKKYIRRVQANHEETHYKHFATYNSQLCEPSIYSENKTDDVISFPIEVTEGTLFKDNLTAIEHLQIIKSTQENWVGGGQKNNKKPISNSVSCTVLVGEDEWEEVARYIYEHKDFFSTVSLLSKNGDKTYAQAPYESMRTNSEIEEFFKLRDSFIPVDYSLLVEEDDFTVRSEELACSNGLCSI